MKDKLVFAFGRMQPPTIGHEKLVQTVQDLARVQNADARIYLSHTHDRSRNPLKYADKINIAQQAFGNIVQRSGLKNIIQLMKKFEKDGYKEVSMVVGSDRVDEFRRILGRYNGKDFTFNNVYVLSAGERDADDSDVSGMSATKIRKAAKDGDFDLFKHGMPKSLSVNSVKTLFKKLQESYEQYEIEEIFENLFPAEGFVTVEENKTTYLEKRFSKVNSFEKTVIDKSHSESIYKIKKVIADRLNCLYDELNENQKNIINDLINENRNLIKLVAKDILDEVREKELKRNKSLQNFIEHKKKRNYDVIKEKANQANIKFEILHEVYLRGLQMKHNKNKTIEQVAFDRINSFINKGYSYKYLDKDLSSIHEQQIKIEEEKEYNLPENKERRKIQKFLFKRVKT